MKFISRIMCLLFLLLVIASCNNVQEIPSSELESQSTPLVITPEKDGIELVERSFLVNSTAEFELTQLPINLPSGDKYDFFLHDADQNRLVFTYAALNSDGQLSMASSYLYIYDYKEDELILVQDFTKDSIKVIDGCLGEKSLIYGYTDPNFSEEYVYFSFDLETHNEYEIFRFPSAIPPLSPNVEYSQGKFYVLYNDTSAEKYGIYSINEDTGSKMQLYEASMLSGGALDTVGFTVNNDNLLFFEEYDKSGYYHIYSLIDNSINRIPLTYFINSYSISAAGLWASECGEDSFDQYLFYYKFLDNVATKAKVNNALYRMMSDGYGVLVVEIGFVPYYLYEDEGTIYKLHINDITPDQDTIFFVPVGKGKFIINYYDEPGRVSVLDIHI